MFKYGAKRSQPSYSPQMPNGPANQAPAGMQGQHQQMQQQHQNVPGQQPQYMPPEYYGGAAPNYSAQAPAPGYAPPPAQNTGMPANPAPPAQFQAPNAENERYISKKIYKINGKDKVIDFTSKLSVAKVDDFANVHGCGGKNHSPNSTVALTLCDYTKGTGENSVTVGFNLDVEFMEVLYEAAMNARLGQLAGSKDTIVQNAALLLNDLTRWEAAIKLNPIVGVPADDMTTVGTALATAVTGNNPAELSNTGNMVLNELRRWTATQKRTLLCGIPVTEIAAAKNALSAALTSFGAPYFEYSAEKNNPHVKNNQGYVPVSKVYISYTPTRKDGSVSRYPWFVQIENFDAPLNTKQNGATAHNAAQAVNKRSASINLSADDFACAMVAVRRYVRLWEMAAALPVIRTGLKFLADIQEKKRQNGTRGQNAA